MRTFLGIWMMAAALTLGSATACLADFEAGVKANNAGDYATALMEWRPLAERGDMKAQFNLAQLYDFGRGVAQDNEEAMKWYRMAADQGLSVAQYNLAKTLYDGQGIAHNYKEADKWFRKAAEQGLIQAQFNLGQMYYNGRGVAQDYREAMKWYRKAAEQGDAQAQLSLGFLYIYGHGVDKSRPEGMGWFRKSAEQGNRDAQNVLGVFYNQKLVLLEKNIIQIRDKTVALMWLIVASMDGGEEAVKEKSKLEQQMTSAQVTEAQRLARECVKNDYKGCGH
jgi:uncharacterized protein